MLSRGPTIESQALIQLVDMLSSTLRHGGGSLVEIYKTGETVGHVNTMNMLGALSFIDKAATVWA